MSNNNTAIKELTELTPASEWKDWLNNIQAFMIATEYCNGLSKKGASEFAGNFLALHNFFNDIRKVEN